MGITDIEYVKELARILNNNNLAKIEISDNGKNIVLEKSLANAPAIQKAERPPETINAAAESQDIINFNSMVEIKSPIVGVFYSAPSPEAENFVSIGDTVKKGDVLCIIESMKLLNEITAEQDGEIIDICLKNGDVVEYGQVLFKIV